MDQYFLLDEKSRKLLQQLLDRERRRGASLTGQIKHDTERSFDTGEDHQAPEQFVAKTSSDGIDARDGDTPGKATCTIYRINTATQLLEPSSRYDQVVYNITEEFVPPFVYVPVFRDKWGRWFTFWFSPTSSGTGTESGTGTTTNDLIVQETDGSPSYNNITRIQLRSMFFKLSQPLGNTARIDYPTGVIEFTTSTYTVTNAHFGKVLTFTGSGQTTISGIGACSTGFKCAVFNAGSDQDAIIRWDRTGSGDYDYIPLAQGFDVYKPNTLIGDVASNARGMPGLTQFGVRKVSGTYTLTPADMGRLIVFTGAGNFNLFVPTSDNTRFACAVSALGGNVNVVRATGRELDADTQNIVLEQGCNGVWIFTDGTDWFTVKGNPCDDDSGTGTGTGTADCIEVVTDVSFNPITCAISKTTKLIRATEC